MNSIRKILVPITIIMLLGSMVRAQQDPQYTQYLYNMNVVNPAYAGARGVLSLNVFARKQWVGIQGAPETGTFSIHAPVNYSMGLGFSVIYDRLGPVTETNSYADFSYTIRVAEEGKLAFGLKGGVTLHHVDVGLLDPLVLGDENVLNINPNETYPNFGTGIYYYTREFYLGASIPNVLETKYFVKSNGSVSNVSERMHYFFTSGYVFKLSRSVDIKPSILVKAAFGAPVSVDLSGNVLLNKKVELGLSYRLDDSISAMAGFNISPDFRIGYAYDLTVSNYGNYNSGTHEIMLLFDLYRSRVKNPRFF